jgi:ABC-type transporter Mla subunit MlaD
VTFHEFEQSHRRTQMTSANVSNLNTDTQMTPARPGSSASTGLTGDSRAKVKVEGAMSKIADTAQEAAEEAKRSATTLAAEANEKVKSLLTEQVGVGADLIGHVAASAKVAAQSLEQHAPQLASLVRDASERVDAFSRESMAKQSNRSPGEHRISPARAPL